jgi:hypothetical protein
MVSFIFSLLKKNPGAPANIGKINHRSIIPSGHSGKSVIYFPYIGTSHRTGRKTLPGGD